MSKALAILKLFFSMVSINSTAKPTITSASQSNTTHLMTQATRPVPLLLKPMDQVASFVGQGFRLKIPYDTFYPTYYVGRKENLKLSMFTINEGRISPNSWLRFDSESRTVYGFPLAGNRGKFLFILKATNSEGKTAQDVLKIHVRENNGNHNHEFVIRTKFNLVSFISDIMVRFDFITRFAKYAIHDDVDSVWIKSYNKKHKQITLILNTVPYSPCDKTLLQNVQGKLTTSSGGVKPSFQEALSKKYPISSVELKLVGPCNQGDQSKDGGFQWGVLKHLMPILMLLFVVGVPVGISCVIHRRIKRKRARLRDERKKRRRMENGMDSTFHTVHYNNRYPSMLSVSNNSREDDVTEDDRSSTSKMNIIPNGSTPNGNLPSSVNLAVPSAGTSKQSNNKLNTNAKSNTINLEAQKQTNSSASRVVYMGKSEMNIPVYFTKPKEQLKNDSDLSFSAIAESISSTLKGIGKSVWNIAGAEEYETKVNDTMTDNLSEAGKDKGNENKLVLLASELELPLAEDKKDPKQLHSVSIVQGPAALGIPQRCKSELKLTDYGQYSRGNSSSINDVKGSLMSATNSRLPNRRVSLPHIEMHFDGNATKREVNSIPQGNQTSNAESSVGLTLKGILKSLTDITKTNEPKEQKTEPEDRTVLGELTSQIEQLSKYARDEFGSRNEIHGIEEQHLAEHQLELEERYNDDDEEEELISPEELEAMDYTTWRLRQIKKAERAAKKKKENENQGILKIRSEQDYEIASTEYRHDVGLSMDVTASNDELLYQDYTNPYQYDDGSYLSLRSQSMHLTSQSSGLNWSDDYYEKENCYKQQPPRSSLYSPNSQSMPSLNERKSSFGFDNTNVDNRNKTAEESKIPVDKSILGMLFSRQRPEETTNLTQSEDPGENSLVGYLKTRVGGFLGPSEGSSWFK